jgi:hypothetical protein
MRGAGARGARVRLRGGSAFPSPALQGRCGAATHLQVSRHFSPLFMVATPTSQPLITLPAHSGRRRRARHKTVAGADANCVVAERAEAMLAAHS